MQPGQQQEAQGHVEQHGDQRLAFLEAGSAGVSVRQPRGQRGGGGAAAPHHQLGGAPGPGGADHERELVQPVPELPQVTGLPDG